MGRIVGGIILGYLVMALFVFATFSVAYRMMGADRAFEFDTYDVTGVWIVTSFVLSVLGAILGGVLCAVVGKSAKAPLILAGIVLVLGVVLALPTVLANAPPPTGHRPAVVGIIEAMTQARQPHWLSLLSPLVAALGVVIGGRVKAGRPAA